MPIPSYDFIIFGDELPGILALVSAAREYQRQHNKFPRTLLLFKSNSANGIGGHLVRGKLAYLDRCQVSAEVRQSVGLALFGDPPSLYREFLQKAGVVKVALSPTKADIILRQMLKEVHATLLSNVPIASVQKDGQTLTTLTFPNGTIYSGKYFLDASVNAELAQLAGIPKSSGYGGLGLPNSELPVSLIFETEGISVQQLQQFEDQLIRRLIDSSDREAQAMINVAAGEIPAIAQQLRQDLADDQGQPKLMFAGTDYIDVRSKALSIAYHAFRRTALNLRQSHHILDIPNIATLSNGIFSWNAFLSYVSGTEAEAIATNKSQPTAAILAEFTHLTRWLKQLGATSVNPATELYVRHVGNIQGTVAPLSGADMLAGGVPEAEAIASFSYPFDVRGGITGLGPRAVSRGFTKLGYKAPIFNVGIQHTLLKQVNNLAVVSPASGFDGYASGVGRIVELNCGVAQAVGIAMAIALSRDAQGSGKGDRSLNRITNVEVHQVLKQTNQLPKLYGRSDAEHAQLRAFEQQLA